MDGNWSGGWAILSVVKICISWVSQVGIKLKLSLNCGLLIFVFSWFPKFSEAEVSQFSESQFKSAYAAYRKCSESADWDMCLPHAKNAYLAGRFLFGDKNKNTASLAYNYALNLLELKKVNEAKPILEQTIGFYEDVYGKDSEELIPILVDAGHAFASPKPHVSSYIRFYDRAIKISKKRYSEQSVNHAELIISIGKAYNDRAWLPRKARKYLKKAESILLDVTGGEDARVGMLRVVLGDLEKGLGHKKSARDYYKDALDVLDVDGLPDNKFALQVHIKLVRLYEELGDREGATQHCLAVAEMTPYGENQDFQPLYKPDPEYPVFALGQGRSGWVMVEYEVDDKGFVRNPRIVGSNGDKAFHQPSLNAVNKFRYAPRFEEGKAVTVLGVRNKFKFDALK